MKSKRNHLIVFLIVSGLFFFSGVTASADCPADLISYWPLNETIPGLYADALNVSTGVSVGPNDPVPTDGIVYGAQLFDGSSNRSRCGREHQSMILVPRTVSLLPYG